jgi:hypothetical protein
MMPLLERHFHVTLIELMTLQVIIVVTCCEAHLIRVAAFDEGRRADSPDVMVVEQDDALNSAAGEIGCGTLIMGMVGGLAEPAGLIVRAIPTIMTRVLTVACKAVGE